MSKETEKMEKRHTLRKINRELCNRMFMEIDKLVTVDTPTDDSRRRLISIKDTLKEKGKLIEKLEDQILNNAETEDEMQEVMLESNEFSILVKEKHSLIADYVDKWFNIRENMGNSNKVDVTTSNKEKHNVKLPKMEIQRFSGDPIKWRTFYDCFDAIIHNTKTLSNVEKFTYLRGYLEGEALHAISGISLTNSNYEKAWNLLKERYGNPQLVITSHMNELLKLHRVTSEKDLSGMRKLYDDVENHVRSLQSLGIHGERYGPLLAPVIMDRLPHEFKLTISRNLKQDLWDITRLLELIREELRARENITATDRSRDTTDYTEDSNEFYPHTDAVLVTQNRPKGKCIFCKAAHWTDKCTVVTDTEARKEFLRKGRRCFLCMREGHNAKDCTKTKTCFYCKGFHHSAICVNRTTKKGHSLLMSTNHVQSNAPVLLQTADIILKNGAREVKVKALFDSGSQRSYVTTRVSKCLQLKPESTEAISINTFGTTQSRGETVDRVKFNAKTKSGELFSMEAFAVPNICLPLKNQPVNFASKNYKHLKDLELADSGVGCEINLLIGSDVYWELVTGKVEMGTDECKVVAMETLFGWILNGPVCENSDGTWVNVVNSTHVVFATADQSLENSVKRFWDLETIGIRENEKSVYDEFSESILKNENDRYEVRLPFKEDHPQIHDHFVLCKKRLQRLHETLKRDPDLMQKYDAVFREQKDSGIIEEVKDSGKIGETHYLPHHPVIRDDKNTSKVRIVFDASAKTIGPSLNECLYKGPQLTPLIYDILLRFRSHPIAITADIEKAFLQIGIAETDRNYLRFLWFDDVFKEQPLIIRNRFARVVFGVTSSPFLLNGTVRKHSENYAYDGEFVNAVVNSFFVDDFTGGEQNFEKAFELFRKLQIRFLEGHFQLRKWRTNNERLRKTIEETAGQITESPQKILGIQWDEFKDVFVYEFNDIALTAKSLKPTKRNVLSVLAMFYDPLGIIQPIIIDMKILFQDICRGKCGWDDELDGELKDRWVRIVSGLCGMRQVEVGRYFGQVDDGVLSTELHGFSDASEKAYGACIFVRTLHRTGDVKVELLTAKSRVAPMKPTTIPRLELLGNLLLSRLTDSVKSALTNTNFDGEYFWTDSMITLAWIKAHDKEFRTFVQNRVREIRQKTDTSNWHYIETKINPADIITRGGITNSEFSCNELWFRGPSMLKELKFTIPNNENIDFDECLFKDEINSNKNTILLNVSLDTPAIDQIIDVKKFSTLSRLIRITAWVFRFCQIMKEKINKKKIMTRFKSHLTPLDLNRAEECWIKVNQSNFNSKSKQFKMLEHQLNIVKDDNGMLRCKGRMQNAPLPAETKSPILISPHHVIAELIVEDAHRRNKHVQMKQTLTEVRQKYWIPSGRSLVRKVIYRCRKCRQHHGKPYQYPESPPLTKLRLEDSRAFANTGIDNFGPMFVRNIYPVGDEGMMHKTWATLYTCASTRAVLLDLVPRMTSDAFCRSFRRFISRRGCPNNIISDNGTNFVSEETQNFASNLGIEWHINLPLAPWHGGFFERMVRCVKELLRKQLKNTRLNYEELQTILSEVEMIVNNRPLTYVFSDEIETCLSPNQLLFGRNLDIRSHHNHELNMQTTNVNQYSKKLDNVLNHFWERWRKEYLVSLRESHRIHMQRNTHSPVINANDVVLIEDNHIPRSQWRIARVMELLKGHDNNIRGALVKTPQGTELKRPVNKLYPIEHFKCEPEKGNSQSTAKRSRRNAAVVGELKRRYLTE